MTIDYDDCDVSGVELYVDGIQLGTGPAWHHSPNPDVESIGGQQRASGCYSFHEKDGWIALTFLDKPCRPSPTTTP